MSICKKPYKSVVLGDYRKGGSTVSDDSRKTRNSTTPHRLVVRERPPVAKLIGFDLVDVKQGQAVITFEAGPQHANPMGTLHGGILCDIADAAMGVAFASTLSPEESFTTVELKINFFRPVWQARLRAEGKVVRRGRTVGYVECDVVDEDGRAIAKASSTCLALRGAEAAGR
jgi:uncharacterized protein (TIGR00369 family)